jgi:hypothetical protein
VREPRALGGRGRMVVQEPLARLRPARAHALQATVVATVRLAPF